VEVLRYSKSDGMFKILQKLYPGTEDFSWNGVDERFTEDSIYYVRLRQVGLVRNHVAMAWSSPIWAMREQ